MNIFKNKALIVFIIFLAIGLAIYANSFSNQFFWDDDDYIVNNIYIKDWNYLPHFFTKNSIDGSGQITNYWRPLVLLSFAVDFHTWGLYPIGFHLTNTLLHILVAWLSFLFLYKLFELFSEEKKVSSQNTFIVFLVSLIFLVHPLQTEAITYVAGRADALSSIFCLLSLLFYIYFREKKKIGKFVLSVIFFILGLLTKEQIILLPALILLIELVCFTKRIDKKSIIKITRLVGLFFVISLLYFGLRLTVLNFKEFFFDFSSYTDEAYMSNVFYRLLTFFFVMISYFKLLFVPTSLHMAREVPIITSVFSPYVLSFIVLLILIIILCIKTWKKNRLITFGFLWFFIILLPRTNILKINRPMYEHWLYLPMIGFWLALFLLILLIAKKIREARKKEIFETGFYTIILVLCFIFCILTVLRNRDWRDPITFYEKNLRYTPNSFIQYNNLGMAYAQAGWHEGAQTSYQKAIEIKDIYPQVHHNLANSLVATDKTDQAIAEYKKAIEISPEFILPYEGLLNIYFAQGERDKIIDLIWEMDNIFENDPRFLQTKEGVYRALGIER